MTCAWLVAWLAGKPGSQGYACLQGSEGHPSWGPNHWEEHLKVSGKELHTVLLQSNTLLFRPALGQGVCLGLETLTWQAQTSNLLQDVHCEKRLQLL